MPQTQPPVPLRLQLFSQPRTASNLFCKLFSEHEEVEQHPYNFLYTRMLARTQVKDERTAALARSNVEKSSLSEQDALDRIQKLIGESEVKVRATLRAGKKT